MRYTFISYMFLVLVLFNSLFVLQTQNDFLPLLLSAGQWILIVGNFVLLFVSFFTVERKEAKHFSYHEATIFQLLFFILMIATAVMLLLLLLQAPLSFMIFMPFEFFIIAFYVGFYFLLTRYIFPLKIKKTRY